VSDKEGFRSNLDGLQGRTTRYDTKKAVQTVWDGCGIRLKVTLVREDGADTLSFFVSELQGGYRKEMNNSVIVSLRDIVVEFDGQRILDGLNLDIHDKEFVTLLGSSGCGKTTTLRLIAGFLEPTSGKVLLKGEDITGVPPYKRPVNTVFQKYALFPHLNVFENVAFGLRLKKMDEETIRRKVRDMLEVVGLKGFERRSIGQMSGGQQQRVAIARSLVNEPEILLLDEPLGALDLKLRKEMQLELKRLQREMNITFIYVTHDQEEALTMSDTVVVMNGGKVQQIGTPEDIYNEPKNAFVADFIGDSNIVDGVMHRDFLVSFSGVEFPCVDRGFAREESVQVVVRPEDIEVVSPVEGQLVGVVNDVIFKGVHFEMHVECEGREWLIHSTRACTPGETIGMRIGPNEIHIMSRSEG
jgi:spermidine/putrescine transport system ATP-binding protein